MKALVLYDRLQKNGWFTKDPADREDREKRGSVNRLLSDTRQVCKIVADLLWAEGEASAAINLRLAAEELDEVEDHLQ